MTSLSQILWLTLVTVALVAAARSWVRHFADLLWMLGLRPMITGGALLIVLIVTWGIADRLLAPGLFATRFALVMILIPGPARLLADVLALAWPPGLRPSSRQGYVVWAKAGVIAWTCSGIVSALTVATMAGPAAAVAKILGLVVLTWLGAKPLEKALRLAARRRGHTPARVRGSIFEMVRIDREVAGSTTG